MASRTAGIRQSVSAPLAKAARRIAKERLVDLAERGAQAEHDTKEKLNRVHGGFLKEQDPSKKEAARRNLICAVFGKDAIA